MSLVPCSPKSDSFPGRASSWSPDGRSARLSSRTVMLATFTCDICNRNGKRTDDRGTLLVSTRGEDIEFRILEKNSGWRYDGKRHICYECVEAGALKNYKRSR